jgi:LPS-assembly protein
MRACYSRNELLSQHGGTEPRSLPCTKENISSCLRVSVLRYGFSAAVVLVFLLAPAAAFAQITGFDQVKSRTRELVGDHFKFSGEVVMEQPGMKLYADEVDFDLKTNRLVATGNVLLEQPDHRIAADRADFDAKTLLGTFYKAQGFAALGKMADVSQFGTLQPDVQFYGETIEKTGPQTYLISHGGFTTCAQANPRWEMTSGSIRLRVDHYALLLNMLLKAKGVPVLFLPALYYPISSDARQTGFLMPSYGSSTYRGQVISNGFFWAIGRSQDATILHDWYSKTGQAINGEYRYVSLKGGGNINNTFLNEKETSYKQPDGTEKPYPGQKSFTLNGSLSQALAGTWYAQARANYFSSINVQQRSTADLYTNSRHNRVLGGSTSGTLKGYRITGTYDRNENFTGTTSSSVRGSAPRVNVQKPDRVISRYIPVYASVTNEYVHLNQQDRNTPTDGPATVVKNDIDRLDINSVLRFPFNKLSFLAVNTSLTWRNTFWSDSLALGADGNPSGRIDQPISRTFFEMAANVNGPSFVKIWDKPRSRFKHTIEPSLQVTHRTPIQNANRIINNEYVDNIVGNMTTYAYGGSTRLYAKKTDAGPAAVAREIMGATVQQTYYTDAKAIQSDQQYRTNSTTSSTAPNSHFSAVRIDVHASPVPGMTSTFRTQFDARWHKFQQYSADTSWTNDRLSLVAGWSQTHFVAADATGKNCLTCLSQYLNTNTTFRFKQNRYGIVHSFNWDIHGKKILQQRVAGYYNAQCCGFTAEWQTFDFTALGSNALVPKDRRFHFSVTLAGIGNVSNIFGALSGTPNR